jgi:hypothetical protein
LNTIEFNRNVVAWLSLSKEKTLKEMFMFAASLDEVADEEIRADRFEQVSDQILNQIRSRIEADEAEVHHINELMEEHQSESVDKIKTMFNQMIRFDNLHNR